MNRQTTTSKRPSLSHLPQELIGLIASRLQNRSDLARFSLISHGCHVEATGVLYTDVGLAPRSPRPLWIKMLLLWSRTMISSQILSSTVERLALYLPESELPALFRRLLLALRACVNLRDLELYQSSLGDLPVWLIPDTPRFRLVRFVTNISGCSHLLLFLESQPSIQTLRLELEVPQPPLKPGSLPLLAHYTGFIAPISSARSPGMIWDNLVYAQIQGRYHRDNKWLEAMPRLRALDIIICEGDGNLLFEIAEKCGALRSLTLRDSDGSLCDRYQFADGRLSGIAVLPEFAASFSGFSYLSSLTINSECRLRGRAPPSTEWSHLVAWRAQCPSLCHFNSPTGRRWFYAPADSQSLDQGRWSVVSEPTLGETVFATDPGLFGMRRASGARERSSEGSVDELVSIIERLNRERSLS